MHGCFTVLEITSPGPKSAMWRRGIAVSRQLGRLELQLLMADAAI